MLSEDYGLTAQLLDDILGRERRRGIVPDVKRAVLDGSKQGCAREAGDVEKFGNGADISVSFLNMSISVIVAGAWLLTNMLGKSRCKCNFARRLQVRRRMVHLSVVPEPFRPMGATVWH